MRSDASEACGSRSPIVHLLVAAACVVGMLSSRAGAIEDVSWVYVTAESSDEVYLVRFDGTSATVARRIEVGYQPTEIEGPHGLTVSPDGRHWFLTVAHGKPFGILYKYATGSDELLGQCELGLFPATMQVSAATGLLYCVNFDLHGDMAPSSVSIVDPAEMVEVARTTTGPMPHGSRLSPDGRRHYSCAMMSGQLFELDAVRFDVRRVLDLDTNLPVDPPGTTPLTPAGHDKHDMHGATPTKHDEHRASADERLSKPTWVFPHPDGTRVYVCLSGRDEVSEVDLESWRIVRRFPTGRGPYNLEVSADSTRLVVTYKADAAIGIWDLERGVEQARLPTTRTVTHGVVLSPDGRYAFVSNEGVGAQRGTLDVFDLDRLERVASVELGLQAGGIAFWKTESTD